MLAFSRFRVAADAEAPFTLRADAAVAFFRTRAGNLTAELVRNLDEPELWAIATSWENVGSYRRSFNGYEAKIVLVPLLSEALDEPSAYAAADDVGLNLPRER
ncbi:MAG: antibiotic biosynthesis monooxygenase [Nigerium sp.]|nr:antibiotic biosynthesis monooxygenase [Nigerium sp.]